MKNIQVYLSLGGNEGPVLRRLKYALNVLSNEERIDKMQTSHFYRTEPLQVNSPLWFVNAVCSFQTDLTPPEIFNIIQIIERKLGKVPKPKNAARPIDIDFLFYGHQSYQENDLEIPHPRWKERLFVLIPLADLTDEVTIHESMNIERYVLQDLIQPLLTQSSQAVYLLEKNPHLQ